MRRSQRTPHAALAKMVRPTVLAIVAVACAACALAPATALAGTLDQQQTNASAGYVGIGSGQSGAQTFTAGLSGSLDRVDLVLQKIGDPTAPLNVEIRNASGGVPGTTVLASESVSTAIGASPVFVAIGFLSPAAVVAGTQYSIVLWSVADPFNSYGWRNSSGEAYAGGGPFFVPASPPSTAWTPVGGDLAFKTYVDSRQLPTGQRAAALKRCKKLKKKPKRLKCKKRANRLPV
jgi:hypothetical protein